MELIDFPQVILAGITMIVWMFPAFLTGWVYKHTSSIQSRLEVAQRNQRICGSHVLEKETVRSTAHMIASEDPILFVVVLIAGSLITICACIFWVFLRIGGGLAAVLYAIIKSILLISRMSTTLLTLQKGSAEYTSKLMEIEKIYGSLQEHVKQAKKGGFGVTFYAVIIAVLLVVCMMIALPTLRKVKFGIPNEEYTTALTQIEGMFAAVFAQVEAAKEKGQVVGAWERYKQVLAKRVARERQLPTIEEAENQVDEMLASQRYELIGYIEFDLERDYSTLMEFLPIIHNTEIQVTLEKLAASDGLNPMDAYQQRFRNIYVVLACMSTVIGLMWIYKIRENVSLSMFTMVFFAMITIVVMYTMVA